MTLRVAMVADDLTGALDTSVAFALHGLRTRIAMATSDLGGALAAGPEVVVVNTASRALSPADAADQVRTVAPELAGAVVVFKKVDSRLKGNVAEETAALAQMLGADRVVVAPAVPDQGRWTEQGAVVGRGVERPIAIAPIFRQVPNVLVEDARTDADLDTIVARHRRPGTLLVGSRGLGGALARAIGSAKRSQQVALSGRTLFAFGTRDPITLEQMQWLMERHPDVEVVDAPGGRSTAVLPRRLPAMLRCTGPIEGATEVAGRFAALTAERIRALAPEVVVVGGGDTALALLQELGVRVLEPLGEPLPGIVAVDLGLAGKSIRCLVKSGGFGKVEALAELLDSQSFEEVARQ